MTATVRYKLGRIALAWKSLYLQVRKQRIEHRVAEILVVHLAAVAGLAEYDAEVLIAHDRRGWLQFHDVVGLKPIQAKEKKTSKTVEANAPLDEKAGLSKSSIFDGGLDVKRKIYGKNGEPSAEIIRGGVTKFSLSSWTEKEKTNVRESLINAGYEAERVDKWIGDVDGVAAIIAGDKARLDYTADPDQVMLKNNQE